MFRSLIAVASRVGVFGLLLAAANPALAEIYKWVDENGKVHFSDRKNNAVEQEVVNVKPRASNWSRFDIQIEAVDVELSAAEHQQIEDGVNNVYEFFDRVMFFDMYKTVPVNILIFKDAAQYRKHLASMGNGWLMASYGVYIHATQQIIVYVQEDRARTFETIKHEVSHAVLNSLVPYAPAWLHEGLAEQMEMLERDTEGLYFARHAENSWLVDQARKDGHLADIDKFLKLPSDKFRHSDLSGRSYVRAQASQFLSFLLAKPTRRNFLVRLMHNFNRGDRTLSYYLVNDNYIGGVRVLASDWRTWLYSQGERVVRL